MLQNLIRYFARKPRLLFLVDGIGALLTAFLLLSILLPLQEYFGMPRHIIFALGCIAIVFAIYSLGCYSLLRHHRPRFIRIISLANFSYCALTLSLIVFHFNRLSILGISYFHAEILVICLLAWLEWRTAARMSLQKP